MPSNTYIFIDADEIQPADMEGLTPQQRVDRLDAAMDALVASIRNAPKASGDRAKALIETRQIKLTGDVVGMVLG